jgi:hypothetical protein
MPFAEQCFGFVTVDKALRLLIELKSAAGAKDILADQR